MNDHLDELRSLVKDLPDLTELVQDEVRNNVMSITIDTGGEMQYDFFRQNLTLDMYNKLLEYAQNHTLFEVNKNRQLRGEHINITENRPALHHLLREPNPVDSNLEPLRLEMKSVLDRCISVASNLRKKQFSKSPIYSPSIIVCGIGGSYHGIEFVYESLRYSLDKVWDIRFLANCDPYAFTRAVSGLSASNTIVIVISKTFTTLETIQNAKRLAEWSRVGEDCYSISSDKIWKDTTQLSNFYAVTTNVEAATKFGISNDNIFPMWDCIGGRFSLTSAVGILPLAISFGSAVVTFLLEGAHLMDKQFFEAELDNNIPFISGLLEFYNTVVLKKRSSAILPYSTALNKLVPYIQQLDMESNGKFVNTIGETTNDKTGPIIFGEPGTSSQHSFFQLLHQGTYSIPCEFIGVAKVQAYSQPDDDTLVVIPQNDNYSWNSEIFSNFIAQPIALAEGSKCNEPHKFFPGNRPSTSLYISSLTVHSIGALISLFEHRVTTFAYLCGINPFDQYGVELGKVLAKDTLKVLTDAGNGELPATNELMVQRFCFSQQ